jgi:hypothetical protein
VTGVSFLILCHLILFSHPTLCNLRLRVLLLQLYWPLFIEYIPHACGHSVG